MINLDNLRYKYMTTLQELEELGYSETIEGLDFYFVKIRDIELENNYFDAREELLIENDLMVNHLKD